MISAGINSLVAASPGGADLPIFNGIVFLLLVGILWWFAWGPIARALRGRQEHIGRSIDEARRSHEDAKALLAESEQKYAQVEAEVEQMLAETRREAEGTKDRIIAEARQAAEAVTRRAIREIEAAKNQALADVARQSVDATIDMARGMVRQELSPEEHARLVQQALERLPSEN